MRLVATGRTPHEIREVYDNPLCEGCQGLLVAPHVLIGHLPCSCVPGGHRTRTCRDCGATQFDPPHDETITGIGAGSYFGG